MKRNRPAQVAKPSPRAGATQNDLARRRTLRYVALLLALVLLVATAYHWHPGGGWNIMSRLALLRAVVHDHRLAINGWDRATEDKAEYPPNSGIYYSDKPVGAQILGVIGYALGYDIAKWSGSWPDAARGDGAVVGTWFAAGLPAILGGVVMLQLLLAMGQPLRRSVFMVLVGVLGTMLWPYGTILYGHEASAMLGVMGFAAAFWVARRESPPWFMAALAGLLCAWAAVSELPAFFTLGLVFWYLVSQKRSAWLPYVAGAILPIAIQLAVNRASFGSIFHFGYAYEVQADFQNPAGWVGFPRLTALWGITFSLDKGIFIISPVLLFAAWGLFRLLKENKWRREAIVCLLMAGGFLLYNSGHFLWWGGSCFGPRHLISMIPFLALGLPWAWEGSRGIVRLLMVAAGVWSVFFAFAVTTTTPEPAFVVLTGNCTIWEALVRISAVALQWPNLGFTLGLPNGPAILLHLFLMAVPTGAIYWLTRPPGASFDLHRFLQWFTGKPAASGESSMAESKPRSQRKS